MISWLVLMWCVRRDVRRLTFSARQRYFQALRPMLDDSSGIIAYPDAFLRIQHFDLDRARIAAKEKPFVIAPTTTNVPSNVVRWKK